MSRADELPVDAVNLLSKLCEGELDPNEAACLERLICSNPAVCRLYLEYIDLHVELHRRYCADATEQGLALCGRSPSLSYPSLSTIHDPRSPTLGYLSSGWPVAYLVATVICGVGLLIGSRIYVSQSVQIARQSTLPSPSSTIHYPPSTIHATVARITGMVDCQWAEVGWVKRSAAPPEDSRQGENGSGPASLPSPVFGRGAGGEGGQSPIPNPQSLGSLVSLGDKFALASGLLEITYDTGAKVILQGPVTYEVESAAGGYLSVGKLTAKLEKKSSLPSPGHHKVVDGRAAGGESYTNSPRPSDGGHHEVVGAGGEGGESSIHPSSFILHPLFSVRTPTATVTDLGTEFGVEVSKDGNTTSHVFLGVIEVQPAGDNGQPAEPIRLVENESVRVEKRSSDTIVTVHRGTADPAAFVRFDQLPELTAKQRLKPLQRWQVYSRQLRKDPALVAYYTFESPGSNSSTVPNLSAAGSVLDGRAEGGDWVYGRLPGKLALCFHGSPSDRVVLPKQEHFKFTGAFSVAVWFKYGGSKPPYGQALVGKADTSWLLECDVQMKAITFDTRYEPFPGAPPPTCHLTTGRTDIADGRWHLAVGVYEPVDRVARKRLFIDGRLDAENTTALPLYQNDNPVWIGGNSEVPDRMVCGFIDEVAILRRALSAEEVGVMFEAGRPTDSFAEQRRVNAKETKQRK